MKNVKHDIHAARYQKLGGVGEDALVGLVSIRVKHIARKLFRDVFSAIHGDVRDVVHFELLRDFDISGR